MKVSLKAARINAGYTQREIADKMGVCNNVVINWELGRVKIPAESLLELCRIYGATIDDIFLPGDLTKSKDKESKKRA